MFKYIFKLTLSVFLITLFSSCSKTNETARLVITLTDSPGDFEAVNVDIQSVQVNANNNTADTEEGWTTLPKSSVGVVNLLEYTNGTELTLSNSDFPAGKISQIRLVLGSGNSLTVKGKKLALESPSSMQSGLKLQVHRNLTQGITYKFKLDFDASKSIVKTGNEQYLLKPVINVISEEKSGAIKGIVTPAVASVAVLITDGSGHTIASSYAPGGVVDYLVPGIEPGAYDVVFDPGESAAYKADTIKNIVVTLGMINKMDPVDLVLK